MIKPRFRAPIEESNPRESDMPWGMRLLSLFAGAVIMALALKSLNNDWAKMKRLLALNRLQPVEATILQSKIRLDSAGGDSEWYPDMVFEYFVKGQSIWGWRLSYEELPLKKADADRRIAPYQIGKKVTAYFDPASEKESMLEKKTDPLFREWMRLTLGLAFFIVGALLFFIPAYGLIGNGLKGRKKNHS